MLFGPVSDAETFLVESLQVLTGKIAGEDVTLKLATIMDWKSDEYIAVLENVKNRMKAGILEFWEAQPSFGSAVSEVFGPKMKDLMWAGLPKCCSYDVFMTDLPADQCWLVG